MPKKIITNQKKKCLIIIKGNKGSIIYFNNKRYVFQSNKIKTKNTIGAEDTFLATFVVYFIKTNNIARSGKFATKEVENFLNSNFSNTYEKNKEKMQVTKKLSLI